MTTPGDEKRWLVLPSRSRARIDAEVRDELEGWIAERAAELRAAGVADEDATRRAREEFGDLDAARRACAAEDAASERQSRARRWFDELRTDLRMAWRLARRTPASTLVLLVTFALGIGATTAVYSAVHAVLLRPLPYAREGSLVQLASTDGGALQPSGQLSLGAIVALREGASSIAGISALGWAGFALVEGGEPEALEGARVSANIFDVLGARPALGRAFVAGDDSAGAEPIVVLGDRLWRRRFAGDPSVIGRNVDLNGTMRRIVGVMPPGFFLPTMGESELWVPLETRSLLADVNRLHKYRFLRVFARLRDGVAVESAQADVDRVLSTLAETMPDAYTGFGAKALPVRTAVAGTARQALLVLMGAALLVLAIACANVAAVLLTRTLSRQHELAVRTALGAGRGRVVRQLLAESLALAVAGGALGIALAALAVRALSALGSNALPAGTEVTLDPAVLAFAVTLTAASGVAFGVAPSLAGGRNVGAMLAGLTVRASATRGRATVRRALVVGQLSLSIALLLCAGLFVRSLGKLTALDLGYRTDHVMTFAVNLPERRYGSEAHEDRFWDALFQRIRILPGVERVASAGNVPMGGSSGASIVIDGRPVTGERPPETRYATVSDDYFLAMGIPLLRGRAFSPSDGADRPPVVIVSQKLARRFWGDESPIGARVRLGPDPSAPWHEIVGVVGDVREGSEGDTQSTVYVSQRRDHWGGGAVIVRTSGDPSLLAGALRAAVREVDPLLPMVELRTLEEFHSSSLARRRLPMALMSGFSLVALVLASVGVYGVGANVVAARMRELGIRMALGSTRSGVLVLVLRDAVRMIVAGLAIGLPLALLLSTRVRDLLYDVSPFDPATIVAVVALLAVVALAAGFIPARRATRVDPMQVLRTD